jgi:hypothetical protein
MVIITHSNLNNTTSTLAAMTPHSNSPVSWADLDTQTNQMNAHFDPFILLLEDQNKLKTDLHYVKEEVKLLQDTTNAFSS